MQHAHHASCFVQSRSNVPFSLCNHCCDQVCCFIFLFTIFGMESVKEQNICFNFCFIVAKIDSETHSMLCEAYSNDAWSQTMTYKWLRCFKNGRNSEHDDEQSGRPPTSRSEFLIAQLINIIHRNHQLTDKLQ